MVSEAKCVRIPCEPIRTSVLRLNSRRNRLASLIPSSSFTANSLALRLPIALRCAPFSATLKCTFQDVNQVKKSEGTHNECEFEPGYGSIRKSMVAADHRRHLHGLCCEPPVRLDAVRQPDRRQVSLGAARDPGRLHAVCSH